MKSNLNDMNKKEKGIFIVYCIICAVGAIAGIADASGWWEHADVFWMIAVAAVLAVECTQNWNKNRKLAIIELLGGIIMLAAGIGNKFI